MWKKSSGHGCANCLTSNIVQATWFKNMFGDASTSSFANSYGKDVSYTRAGYSCAGFANFAEWYIFKSSNSDVISTTKIGTYDFNYNNISKYAKIGDILRLNNSHSVIYISASSSGINVLDSNFNGTYNCMVDRHNISYDSYSYFTISRATNRQISPEEPATFKADKYIVHPKDNITFTYGNLTLAEEAKIFFSKKGEIYFSDDATKSVNYTTYFNETGVYSVFVGGRFGSNWTYTEPVTIYVTEPTLSVSHSMPSINENITFHYENLTNASSAILYFEKNGIIYWSTDVSSSKDYTTHFENDGEYYVFVRGYYNGSYIDSEKVKLSVTTPNIEADDYFINTNNPVTLTYSNLTYASLVNLYIKKDNEIYITKDITSSRNYEMIFEEEGLYSVYAGGYYNDFWRYTNTIYIYVTTPLIESNVSHIQMNDTLTFKYSGLTYADAVTLCFEKNGKVYWCEDVTDNREFTTYFQDDGEYYVFARGVFENDVLESNRIKITVVAPKISLSKYSTPIDEELTIEYSGFQYADNVMLQIEKAGVLYKEIDITSSRISLFEINEVGEYSIYAIGTFPNGIKKESNKVTLIVTDLPNKYTNSLVKINSNKVLSVDVEIYNIKEPCNVVVAAYKGNTFVNCTITPYNLEIINTILTGDIDKIKVMVWSDLATLKPLCEAEEITSDKFIIE